MNIINSVAELAGMDYQLLANSTTQYQTRTSFTSYSTERKMQALYPKVSCLMT
jgi:hypothetical protein